MFARLLATCLCRLLRFDALVSTVIHYCFTCSEVASLGNSGHQCCTAFPLPISSSLLSMALTQRAPYSLWPLLSMTPLSMTPTQHVPHSACPPLSMTPTQHDPHSAWRLPSPSALLCLHDLSAMLASTIMKIPTKPSATTCKIPPLDCL